MGKVRKELLTPFGLRTLSPRDPDYHAVHGDEYSYHQGTVWPWLMGAFIEGSILAYGKRKTSMILDGVGYFTALAETLETFGSIPEVFDGAVTPLRAWTRKGCSAQAWNVGVTAQSITARVGG
jgi:glycogen debranching enzyme